MSVEDVIGNSSTNRGGRQPKLVTFREAERIDRSTRLSKPLPSVNDLLVPSSEPSLSLGQLVARHAGAPPSMERAHTPMNVVHLFSSDTPSSDGNVGEPSENILGERVSDRTGQSVA